MYGDNIKTIHLEPSHLCNASCPVCNRRVMGGPKNSLIKDSWITIDSAMKWFTPHFISNLDRMILCGNYGDPMTNPDLIDIIKYFRTYNPLLYITMHTNASGRRKEWWLSLGEAIGKHGSVFFSIDGLKDTNHIYRRGTRWETIMDSAQSYISSGATAIWDFLVFGHNEHQVEEARNLSVKMGFQKFNSKEAFGFVNNNDGTTQPISVYKDDGEFDYFIYSKNSEIKINTIPESIYNMHRPPPSLNDINKEYKTKIEKTSISCMAKNGNEIFVDANGLVFPCCFTAGNYLNPSSFVGHQMKQFIDKFGEMNIDLNNKGLEEIITSEIFTLWYEHYWNIDTIENGRLLVCSQFCGKNPDSELKKVMDSIR